jgi:hypothetical protein
MLAFLDFAKRNCSPTSFRWNFSNYHRCRRVSFLTQKTVQLWSHPTTDTVLEAQRKSLMHKELEFIGETKVSPISVHFLSYKVQVKGVD